MTARSAGLLLAAWTAVNILSRFAVDPRGIQTDQSLYLECGMRMLRGELPYRDFLELNPPLIMYLNLIPAWLARTLRVNPIPVFTVLLALLGAWSAWCALRVARRAGPLPFFDTLALLAIPLGPCVVTAIQQIDAGQREHLFLLLYFPFFVLRVGRAAGWPMPPRSSAIALGCAAACGLCLKPHFLLPALCVEAVLLLRARSWRSVAVPEIAGVVAIGAAYALHFLAWPASMRDAFFGRIVPAGAAGYAAYNQSMTFVLARVAWRFALCGVLTVPAGWLAGARLRPLVAPAAAFTVGALAIVVAQQKGWSQHTIPASGMLTFLGGILLAGLVDRVRGWSAAGGRLASVAAGAAVLTILFAWPAIHQGRIENGYLRGFVERYTRPGDRIAVLSGSTIPVYPAVMQTDRVLVGRHLWGFMFMMALRDTRGAPWAAAERRRYLDDVAEDIARGRPDVVIIRDATDCPDCSVVYFSEFAARDARLSAAMEPYRLVGHEFNLFAFARAVER